MLQGVTPKAAVAFALIYVSYVALYRECAEQHAQHSDTSAQKVNRRNYGFWLNGLIERRDLESTQAAVFGSTMEIAYGVGKLFAGPVADNVPPASLLIVSIVIAAACNALMFTSGVFVVDVALWGLNGFAQAFSWPAIALIFFNWFGDFPGRGTLYSVLSTNQNVGSALTPVLLTPLVAAFGWRSALWGPAVVGGGVAALLMVLLRDGPAATPAKKTAEDKPSKKTVDDGNFAATVRDMMTTPYVWLLGLGYALLTFARVGLSDWTLVFIKAHHRLPAELARDCLVALEFGGFAGGLAAGFVSDALFQGRRAPVMVTFSAAIAAPAVWCIFNWPALDRLSATALYAAFGFGSFGPHVLVGLMARELFPTAPSTAASFAKSLAQLGGSLAGVPVSMLAERHGWGSVAQAWALSMLLAGLAFAPLGSTKRLKTE